MTLFIGALYGLFALCLPVVTLLHELGHAAAARCLGALRVEVHVGSYGEQAGAWRAALPGRVTLWFKLGLRPLRGLCRPTWDPARPPGVTGQAAFILAGPLASTAVAAGLLWPGFHYDFHGAFKLVLIVFGLVAGLDLVGNLLPLRLRVKLASGEVLYSDGYQLYRLIARTWFGAEEDYAATYRTAAALYNAGRYADSAPLFRQLLGQVNDAQIYPLAFTAYYNSQQFAAALALAEEYPALAATLDDYAATRAYLLARTNQFDAALELYGQLLAADPAPPTGLQCNRAYVHLLAGHYPEAVRDLDAVLAREPDHAYAHAQRGRARLALGDDAGLADLHRALALNPAEPHALCNLGLHAHTEGRYPVALAYLEQAAALDPHLHQLAEHLAATRACLAVPGGASALTS